MYAVRTVHSFYFTTARLIIINLINILSCPGGMDWTVSIQSIYLYYVTIVNRIPGIISLELGFNLGTMIVHTG